MQLHLYPLLAFFAFSTHVVAAQTDSLKTTQLNELTVTAFETNANRLSTSATVGVINGKIFEHFSPTTFTNAANSIAGVRMEERSPGSYRFSVRGSMIRSPFGVRNVKFYWNGIPFTDASGNTPLNSMDFNSIQNMEIIKGPGSSLYGAGTGGVVLMGSRSENEYQNRAEQSIGIGKYGFLNSNTSLQVGDVTLQYGHTLQDGYRKQSAMGRDVIRFTSNTKIGNHGTLSLIGIYSDLHYQTPGGITLAQYQSDPTLARQPTPTLPGSEAQRATIYTKMALLGGNYMLRLSENWTQSTALYLTTNDFANPFISNFEKRDEQGLGGRNFWKNNSHWGDTRTSWTTGFEWQYSRSAQRNYDNKGGVADKQQTVEDIKTTNLTAFSQLEVVLPSELTITAGLSYNTFKYKYEKYFPLPFGKDQRSFDGILVPRIALNKVLAKSWAVTASYSDGYSPPTLQEVRPSAGGFRKDLNAEKGTNLEIGLRHFGKNFTGEISLYQFGMRQTIVRRTDAAGAEYFINAGKTSQKGLEWTLAYEMLSEKNLPLTVKLWTSGTYTRYTFKDYKQGEADLNGKLIPGVPRLTETAGVDLLFKYGISAFATYQYGAAFYLNDANTIKNTAYNQWLFRASWKHNWSGHFYSELSASAEKVNAGIYSLGYDLNAFGSRFYNGAPKSNYWLGVKLGWEWARKQKN